MKVVLSTLACLVIPQQIFSVSICQILACKPRLMPARTTVKATQVMVKEGRDGKGDAGDKPGGNGKALYRHGGQLDTSNGSGQYTLESLNNGTVECMIVFEIASATVATSCPSAQCDFAWSIELGTKTTSIAGNACAFWR